MSERYAVSPPIDDQLINLNAIGGSIIVDTTDSKWIDDGTNVYDVIRNGDIAVDKDSGEITSTIDGSVIREAGGAYIKTAGNVSLNAQNIIGANATEVDLYQLIIN